MDLSQAGMIETSRNDEVLGMIALDRRDHLVDEERVAFRIVLHVKQQAETAAAPR
jgi:hypothetical protein